MTRRSLAKPAVDAVKREIDPGDGSEAAGQFNLRHHLPHLLRRSHFESEGLFATIYGDDVTSRQLALLTAVAARPGASQSAIAADIGVDHNTCSDVVVRSVAKGLLRRTRSVADARTFALDLTGSGHRFVATGRAKAQAYAHAVSARLDEAERHQLVALLRKLLGFS